MRGDNIKQGFTLIEVVMVMGIFLIAMTAATSIFVSTQKVSRRTVALTQTSGDVRFVMEKMVDDIRLAAIDYDVLRLDGEGKTSYLPLVTSDGRKIGYGIPDVSVRESVCGGGRMCVALADSSQVLPVSLIGKTTTIQRLDFHVWPEKDPFLRTTDGRTVAQPRVTIVLETETIGSKKEEQAKLALQTTVSTRVYKR